MNSCDGLKFTGRTNGALQGLLKALDDPAVARFAIPALGYVSPHSPRVLEAITGLLRDRDRSVEERIAAAEFLGKLDPLPRQALDRLLELVEDRDSEVTESAIRILGRVAHLIQSQRLLSVLSAILQTSPDRFLRIAAAEASRQIGPPALPALIQAMQEDPDPTVRLSVAEVTAAIYNNTEQPSKRVVGAFEVVLIKDLDWQLRAEAAQFLGQLSPSSIEVVPTLIQALRDENQEVRQVVAKAIASIALELHDKKRVAAIDTLKVAAQTMRNHRDQEVRLISVPVQRTVDHLQLVLWNQILDRTIAWNKAHPWAPAYGVWLLLCLVIYWIHPLTILRLANLIKPLSARLPAKLGSIHIPVEYLLLLGFLKHRPRVLDAWVKHYLDNARERFEGKPTVQDRSIHIPIPVVLDGEVVPEFSSRVLRQTFAADRSRCLLIWGEGGAGKTSLACQIARWSMDPNPSMRPVTHIMLPILLEQEIEPAPGQVSADVFCAAVATGLKELIGVTAEQPTELLKALLGHRRILVIIDHLSEMSDETQRVIQPMAGGFAAGACIVTTADEWQRFLADIDRMSGGIPAIRGFLIAVLDCYKAYGTELTGIEFISSEIERRIQKAPMAAAADSTT